MKDSDAFRNGRAADGTRGSGGCDDARATRAAQAQVPARQEERDGFGVQAHDTLAARRHADAGLEGIALGTRLGLVYDF